MEIFKVRASKLAIIGRKKRSMNSARQSLTKFVHPCRVEFIWENVLFALSIICIFYIISQHWDDAGRWTFFLKEDRDLLMPYSQLLVCFITKSFLTYSFFHLRLLYQPYLGLCQVPYVQSHQRQPMSAVAITAICQYQGWLCSGDENRQSISTNLTQLWLSVQDVPISSPEWWWIEKN